MRRLVQKNEVLFSGLARQRRQGPEPGVRQQAASQSGFRLYSGIFGQGAAMFGLFIDASDMTNQPCPERLNYPQLKMG
jgi:hypothetical protein